MSLPVEDVLSTTVNRGQMGALIAWKYIDTDTGTTIVPTAVTARLYDTNSIQRDPANTANTTSSTFVPSFDTTGAVTGVVNAAYFTITTMAIDAALGLWYVQSAYTHESVPKTQEVGFNVAVGGADMGGGTGTVTVPVYACAKDVENFLLLNEAIGQNSTPKEGAIDSYIMMAEGEFERRSGTAYKPIYVQDEVHDIEALRQRHRDFLDEYWFAVPRPIHLNHRPVMLPFSQARGHKIEVYQGSDTTPTTSDPLPRWSDWLDLTHGRDNDYWIDWQKGHLFIRKTFVFRRASAVRVSYEYGKPITTTTSPVATTATSVNVVSTHGYQTRGIIRIGRTYYHHTGKTGTSFTGVTQGAYGTQSETQPSGSEVMEVPEDIRRLITMRAASLYLQNERFIAVTGDNSGGASSISDLVRMWNEEWERSFNQYQSWSTF